MEASDLRAIARSNLAGNWMLSVGVAFVASLLGGSLTTGGTYSSGSRSETRIDGKVLQQLPNHIQVLLTAIFLLILILAVVNLIIGGTVQLGYARFLLKQYGHQEPRFNDLFSQFHRFGDGFSQALLRSIFTALWSLLFIIPGIVKSYAYAMTPFILAEHPEMSTLDAITASREMMDGHKGELFWLNLTFFGWNLLSLLTLGIGNLFLNPYMNASYAAFYRYVSRSC